MAYALLLLCGAAMVAATSYSDYSGVRMPQYGSVNDYEGPRDSQQALEQYNPHSPDTSASQDYKLENDPPAKLKTIGNDFDDADEWHRPVRKHKVRKRPLEMGDSDASRQYERNSELTSLRASRRQTKHRSRLKNEEFFDNKEQFSRTPLKYSRDRKEDFNDNIYIDKDDFSDDKSRDFEDNTKFNKKKNIKRTIRRKPRDRLLKTSNIDIDQIRHKKNALETYDIENIDPDNHLKDSLLNQVLSQLGRNNSLINRKNKIMTDLDVLEPNMPEKNMPERDNIGLDTTYTISEREKSDNSPDRELGRDFPEIGIPKRGETVAEPADAVDMRELGRNAPVRDNTPRRHEPIASHPQKPIDDEDDDEEHAKKSKPLDEYENYYDMKRIQKHRTKQPQLSRKTVVWTSEADVNKLWTHRRTDVPDYDEAEGSSSMKSLEDNSSISPAPTPLSNFSTSTRKLFYNINRHPIEHDDDIDDDKKLETDESSMFNTTTTINATDQDIDNAQAANASELSPSQQSILSILKKAHRKEMLPAKETSKPPVLLQVTKHIPTVVMVEPPGPGAQMRSEEMAADTPERIEKVKRLFRHKLLVGAKNIQDLTNNWDSVVCDYVDVSMLDNDGNIQAFPDTVMYLLAVYLHMLQQI